jgi:hypothetical protein
VPDPNGWYGLLSISQEAATMAREDGAEQPVDCWYDGEPLIDDHCSFCGRVYARTLPIN